MRAEISDDLIGRLHLDWMIDILMATCELYTDDVKLARLEDIQIGQELTPHPITFEAAVAAIACDDAVEEEPVCEDTMSAMRWACKLKNDCSVLELVRSLPAEIVQEQVRLWKARGDAPSARMQKLIVGLAPSLTVK